MRMSRPRTKPSQRPQIDDSSLALSQIFQRFARYQKRPACVRGKDGVPLFDRQLVELGSLVVRGVIDQNIETAQFPRRLLDGRSHALFLGDVAAQRDGAPAKAPDI